MKNKILLFVAVVLMLSGCDDLFTPAIENHKDVEQMYTDASFAQGFLVNVYNRIPSYYDNSEYATDDAVTNETSNAYRNMATGSCTASSYNPLNRWPSAYNANQYIKIFIENVEQVKWAEDEEVGQLFNRRTKGEAYGMRGVFLYYLLVAHGGVAEDGELLGVPILTEFQTTSADFNQPRASFAACVEQIYKDLDLAEEYLPIEYGDVTEVPANFRNVTTEAHKYNRVMGAPSNQLFNGLHAKAFRAKTALLAASPAYQDASNPYTWAEAANAAATLIDYSIARGNGSDYGLANNGWIYYSNTSEIANLREGLNPPEMIWRQNLSNNNTQEAAHYPPSVFGTGRMNPSQNLVDAFPMANGYPITADPALSGYNSTNPYANRDPRLREYIIYNGSTGVAAQGSTIHTGSQSGTNDGINVVEQASTRTGYYMKKRLRIDINMNPASTTTQTHYNPRIRYTEIYLAYAEAANEAWGPTGTGDHAYSAYDIIKAIRKRAGVGGTDDPYLESVKNDKDTMRELIRNERRLELCFESFRFWDLRRWDENLNETIRGINWRNDGTYELFNVEERSFQDYMKYPPIPYSETLKYNNLIQNRGWR